MNKIVTYIFIIILTSCSANKEISSVRTLFQNPIMDENLEQIMKLWTFVKYQKPFEVKVIDYYPATGRCNRAIQNALAIGIKNLDTIRIIDQCPGFKNYVSGDILIFEPDYNPRKDNSLGFAYIDGEPNPVIFEHPKVKLTTFGYLKRVKNY